MHDLGILGQASATTIAMPMLPPRLRIRLQIAVPWVRMWRGRVEKRDDVERHEGAAEAEALQQARR